MAEQHTTSEAGFLCFWSCLADLWAKQSDDCSPSARANAMIGLLEAIS